MTFKIPAHATINENLNVKGDLIIEDDVTVRAVINVTGNLIVGNDVSLLKPTKVDGNVTAQDFVSCYYIFAGGDISFGEGVTAIYCKAGRDFNSGKNANITTIFSHGMLHLEDEAYADTIYSETDQYQLDDTCEYGIISPEEVTFEAMVS